jgi:signal transduction histidine kinase
MGWLLFIPVLIFLILLWYFRFHLLSLYNYIIARLELKKRDFRLLSSLRDDLVHERKKKTAGMEMIISSWERGDEIQSAGSKFGPRYEYFQELLDQLKIMVKAQRRNLITVTRDIWLWAKLWNTLRKVEKTLAEEREKSDVTELRNNLTRFQKLLDQTVKEATDKLSFTLNEILEESVKTVRMEKSELTGVAVKVELDPIGNTIRLSYDKSREWQRILTNLIRNAIEAVEAKQSGAGPVVADLGLPGGEAKYLNQTEGAGVAADLSLRGGADHKVVMYIEEAADGSVSVIIQDSGIGMDEATRSSFYKKGFTLGKESGLGLGVTEESVDLINRFGSWEIDSRKGIGTKITINIDKEKARQAELFAPEEKYYSRTKLALVLSIPLVIAIGLTLLFVFNRYSRFWIDWNPNSAQVQDGKLLIAYNKEGDELWRRRFAREIHVRKEFDSEKGMEVLKQSVHIDDVNSDGKNEILVGFLESESDAGFLMCLDYRGNELWSFLVGGTEVYKKGGQIYAPSREVFVVDIDQDGEKEIILSSNCKTWFPCQLLVLSKEGGKEGEYWHSGHFAIQFIKDMDNDDEQEIVCGGVNNHMGPCPVVFILDGMNVEGQSPPYTSEYLPKAKEEIYVKIPRLWDISTKVGAYPSGGIYYNGTEKDYEEYVITVDDYERMRREYVVDQYLQPRRNVTFTPAFHDEWARLRQAGLIDFDVTPEVIKEWMDFERWENGVKVR